MITKWLASALGLVSIAASFFFGMWQMSQKARATDRVKAEKKKSEVQGKASDALVGGLTKEQEVRNEKDNTNRRDHFTKQ